MKNFKKILKFVLIAMMLFSCLILVGCKKQDGGSGSSSIGKKIICKASDFEAVKGDWYGLVSLLGDKAESAHTTNLLVGEKYYFVYTVDLQINSNSSVGDFQHTTLDYYLQFRSKSRDGVYHGEDAVETHGITNDGGFHIFDEGEGVFKAQKESSEDDLRAYFAMAFTPKQTGMLCVESELHHQGAYVTATDSEPYVYATVMENASDLENSPSVTISNLSYGLVGQDVYESGQLDGNADLAALSQMAQGRNYVVVDFEVTSESDSVGEVGCGIYMHEGAWEDVKLEQANTSQTTQIDWEGGTIFDFFYSTPKNGTKKIRTVLSFTTLDICSISFEFFVYSDNTGIKGTVYDNDCFMDQSVSQLKFRVDPFLRKSYVTGYETMTGNVVIPSYYENYPVVGIDNNAFSNCTDLKLLQLGRVKTIGDLAFSGCTALETLDLGRHLQEIDLRAFENCSSLKEVQIPGSTCVLWSYVFFGCSALEKISFVNPDLWEVVNQKTYETDANLSMSDPVQNVRYLTEDYVKEKFAFHAVVSVENFEVGFVDKGTYESGNYESSIIRDWNGTMKPDEECYWILDFDVTFLCESITEDTWGFYITPPDDYMISVEKAIGANVEDAFSTYDENSVRITSFRLEYGEKTEGPVHIRVILSVSPSRNNASVSWFFTDVYMDGIFYENLSVADYTIYLAD